MKDQKPLTMLRIYEDWVDFYKGDEDIARIVRLLREHPGLIDDIWLSTLHLNQSFEEHRKCAADMKKRAEAIRAEGVSVSMQISEFIGHFGGSTFEGGYAGSTEDMMVGSSGETVPGIHCPSSPSFLKHVAGAVGIYIEAVHPSVVYIDDDLRFDNHGAIQYGCFCERCLKGFAEFSGKSRTREELVRILNDRSRRSSAASGPISPRKGWPTPPASSPGRCMRSTRRRSWGCRTLLMSPWPTARTTPRFTGPLPRALAIPPE